MSLQKEILALFVHTYNRGLSASKGYTQESTDIAINKVLDAAVDACEKELLYDEYDPSRTFIEAINKLRVL